MSRISGLALALVICSQASASPQPASPQEALLSIHLFDQPYAVEVGLRERKDPRDGLLFHDLPEGTKLHPSFDATYELCNRFNAYNSSDSEVSEAEIDAYLETVVDMAPIQEAFRITGMDSIRDLRKSWFRGGRGFEHVICGEAGRGSKLGGYHFWYLQYRYEREGRAEYQGADYGKDPIKEGIADERIVTGKMAFDPDGDAGRPPLVKKPRGGFTVGHSVAAMLATGHIALHGDHRDFLWTQCPEGDRNPGLLTVLKANLNGKTYPWTFHKDSKSNSVRTLWPRFVPGMFLGE